MGVFDRFRRNRQQSVLPDEVKQYYQTENRQRRGMAVVLAIGALIATVAVAAALFFGGRFIYDKVRNDDGASQTADENKDNGGEFGNQEQAEEQTGQQPGSDEQNNDGQNPAPALGTPGEPGTPPASTPSNPETNRPAGTPAPTPGSTPTPAPAAISPLGDNPLPRTGDEGM